MMRLYKITFYFLMAVLLMKGLCGCAVGRHSIKELYFRTDSASSTVKKESENVTYSSHSLISRDTAIAVPGKAIGAQFTPAMLDLLFTRDGKATERKIIIDTNGLRLTILRMLDSSLSIQCEADSYKILVQNLMRENTILRTSSTAKLDSTAVRSTNTKQSYQELKVKVRGWLFRNGIFVLIAILGLYLVGDYVHRKRKKS